ncbi:GMP synthase-like glutamine amidotransferase [Stackebrandtia albiflava]|uniref:GMP synthase-like glutamine amidotransferase n=1 Tax=Stackebrandtia albiflava TaxID=406432 RepID=A0A562UQL3_9ACTN|nr:type 1 glutamine amidotransferase [Stackebrandtia albiflava]TWJ07884.1 GMP synthase-like glutamine amidotransferase [Stackebrandtia albiflava]
MGRVLVIENSPRWHLGRMRRWLDEAGLEPAVVRPHADEPVPADAGDHDAVVALGGGRGVAWNGELAALLNRAVADSVPTLAVCSSARLLATEFGGATGEVDGFHPGPRLVGRRDAAADDPLFAAAPMAIDVVWWRHEEITALPEDALLLAASPHGVPEAFRIGDRAWGVQSHMELDAAMIRALDGGDDLAERVDAVQEHLEETWRPVVHRFGGLVSGRVAGTPLPLLDS